MNYNNIASTSHLIYERQQSFYRILLFLFGSVMTLMLLFNLLHTNDDNIIAQPTSVFRELGNTIYDLTSLELSTEQPAPTPVVENNLPISNIQKANISTPAIQWKTVNIKPGDTLMKIAHRLQLPTKDILKILAMPQAYQVLTHLKSNHSLNYQLSHDLSILKLSYVINDEETLSISRSGDQFITQMIGQALTNRLVIASIIIHHSLFHSALPKTLLNQLTRVFGTEININNDIHSGDHLSVLYEEKFKNGKAVHTGNIVAAQISDHGKTYAAIRYEGEDGQENYYSPTGQDLEISFLRAPLHYTYVSSPFNLHRLHPILHIVRPHLGVDLAAPSGTPVVATSNGRIAFIGRQGGFGNLIEIKFNSLYSAYYGHLARFAGGIHRGNIVHKGEVIGYVGMSGLASGPHLHYEFHIKGKACNPMTVKLPTGEPISSANKKTFANYTRDLLAQLQSNPAKTTSVMT